MNPAWADKTINDVRAIHVRNEYIRLILLWALFEAWIRDHFPRALKIRIKDRERLDWFRKTNNDLKRLLKDFNKSSEYTSLCLLARELKIKIRHAGKKENWHFPNPKNASDVIQLIYLVRCKISHGEWQLTYIDYPKESSMVTICTKLLMDWVGWARVKSVLY